MTENLKWYESNFPKRLELCERYLSGMFDADKNKEPFFGITRLPDGTLQAHHAVEIGIPHVTGRACDIMYTIESTTGKPIKAEVEKVYVDYLFSCCDLEDYLPVFYWDDKPNLPYVEFHNLRECLESLVWLIQLRGSERASRIAQGMLDTIETLTNPETHRYDVEMLKKLSPEKADKFSRLGIPLPLGQGRLVGPLLLLHRATGNLKALKLAGWYAESTMEYCFSPEGLVKNEAANHVHSITSSLSGILAYALYTGRNDLYEHVKKVYVTGLRNAYSSYGYCKEQLWFPSEQGESNQVGDLIQVQLMFAQHEHSAKWYSRAEKFMRGGLLPAQVITTDGYTKANDNPESDAQYNMQERGIGGFGFPNPSCHLSGEHCELNTIDITQGSVQGICAFMKQIVTRKDEKTYLNLLFDTENEYAKVTSALPLKGQLVVEIRKGGMFAARIPERCKEGTYKITRNGKEIPYFIRDSYAEIGCVLPGDEVIIEFEPEHSKEVEFVCHKPYTVEWYGEQACGISPEEGLYPLFGEFPPIQ